MAKSVGVAGTHGKTTTTSMLMLVLAQAGWQPSLHRRRRCHRRRYRGPVDRRRVVGGGSRRERRHARRAAAARHDPAQPRRPLDHYATFDDVVDSFDHYLAAIPDKGALRRRSVVPSWLPAMGITFGSPRRPTYAPSTSTPAPVASSSTSSGTADGARRRRTLGPIALRADDTTCPRHRRRDDGVAARRAVQAITAALAASAGGTPLRHPRHRRRTTFVDDYAHLPAEIAAVLAAARGSRDGWQRGSQCSNPTASTGWPRSARLRSAFVDADLVVITDIYFVRHHADPWRHRPTGGRAICDAHPDTHVVYLPNART